MKRLKGPTRALVIDLIMWCVVGVGLIVSYQLVVKHCVYEAGRAAYTDDTPKGATRPQ